MTDQLWTLDVGFTVQRPIIVDQYVSRVSVFAPSWPQAMDVAVLMVGGRRCVEMVTSTEWCP